MIAWYQLSGDLHPMASGNKEQLPSLAQIVSTAILGAGWSTTRFPLPRIVKRTFLSTVIFASRGNGKVVVEYVVGSVTTADLIARQRLYERSSIRCLWLLTHHTFPIEKSFPAACVRRTKTGSFDALLPSRRADGNQRSFLRDSDWAQVITLHELISAAFSGRFWYGTLRPGLPANIRLDGAFTKCMHCSEWTNLCAAVEVIPSNREATFAFYSLENLPPHLLADLVPSSLVVFKVGPLIKRFTRGKKGHVVNSCVRCGAAQETNDIGALLPITQFTTTISPKVAEAAARLPSARWRISGQ